MRIALCVQYDGSNYCGWQKQPQQNIPTIQKVLEFALSKIANHQVATACAGRTDAGVHALGQVIHFDTSSIRSESAWVRGTNSYLPQDIRVMWAKQVSDDFHARYCAISRQYRYIIHNSSILFPLLRKRALHVPYKLNENLMHQASQYLVGEHDFSSFRGKSCQSKSTIRNIIFMQVFRDCDMINIDVKANAFLFNMIRIIVGTLIRIGLEKEQPLWAYEVLKARDRISAANTVQAHGLYLVNVDYSTYNYVI